MSQEVTRGAKIPRHDMPCQAPEERIRNFNEVALGYTAEMAHEEATRCLSARSPCAAPAAPWTSPFPTSSPKW